MRTEVKAFAGLMEAQLAKHDGKPGWRQEKLPYLFRRLNEEVTELFEATMPADDWKMNADAVGKEAADVANFAMMIADICHALEGR